MSHCRAVCGALPRHLHGAAEGEAPEHAKVLVRLSYCKFGPWHASAGEGEKNENGNLENKKRKITFVPDFQRFRSSVG